LTKNIRAGDGILNFWKKSPVLRGKYAAETGIFLADWAAEPTENVFAARLRTGGTNLTDLSRTGKADFVSAFEKAQGSAEKALDKLMDSYDKE